MVKWEGGVRMLRDVVVPFWKRHKSYAHLLIHLALPILKQHITTLLSPDGELI
jgi:hypothetical protein